MDADLTAPTQKKSRMLSLFVWLGVSFATLSFGGWLTSFGLGEWYQSLNFPSFQPPPWLFSPAWIVIMTLLAIATWRLTGANQTNRTSQTIALILYGAQIVLNCGWSLLFFALRRPDVAMWEILLLDAVMLGMVISYWRDSKLAGMLLLPYFGWLLFATALNISIVNLNPDVDWSLFGQN